MCVIVYFKHKIPMSVDTTIFKKLGFSDKHTAVYLALIYFGPSSVRTLAQYCHLNRGTTYDALKWLRDQGVVDVYNKASMQHFVAEPPEKILAMVENQTAELASAHRELDRVIPELAALYHRGGERPVARYIEKEELKTILEDVLATCSEHEEKMYRIYSAEGVRKYLYEQFLTFSDARIANGISVRVIAIGEGGELRGLDERKWLPVAGAPLQTSRPNIGTFHVVPTYILIYPGKTAYISLNAHHDPVGVVIENSGVYETQKIIFDQLWKTL